MENVPNGRYTGQLFFLLILFDLFFGLFFLRGFCRFLFGGLLAVLAFAHDVVSLSLRLCCLSITETFVYIISLYPLNITSRNWRQIYIPVNLALRIG